MAFLSSLPGIVVIVFGFGVLIFVHEMGHFLAAKWAGIRTEGFAVGMGPVMMSWRKGVGFALGSTERRVVARVGKPGVELSDEELHQHGIGETEYSLRWLPIGGFVKMLGQDDLRPGAATGAERSYTSCPVGKRMIVVSAGVIMNVLLAIVLFVVAFLAGVRVEAPVIGDVSDLLPAGTTMADNAATLGVTSPGLEPGDVVTFIDGDPTRSFADLQIASAMGRPGVPLHLVVERPGVEEPLRFTMRPAVDPTSGLLSIGVAPGSSTVLVGNTGPAAPIGELLERTGLTAAGVTPGMQIVEADGRPIGTYEQLQRHFERSDGRPVQTAWQATGEAGQPTGAEVVAVLEPAPDFALLRYPELAADGVRDFEFGLFGLTPLTKVQRVLEGSANAGILLPGDVIVGVGSLHGPRRRDVIEEIKANAGRVIPMTVLRGGVEMTVSAAVSRAGRVGIELGYAWDVPLLAEPMTRVAPALPDGTTGEPVASPVADLGLGALTRLVAVGGTPVGDWPAVREAFRAAAGEGKVSVVTLTVEGPGAGGEPRDVDLVLSAPDVQELAALAWHTALPSYAFEPIFTTLSAEGSPLLAVRMGFLETHKMIMMTYLTIDRLFRGTVGVEQLRGPVGIIDLGAKILPRGFNFFLFFLGMISVNLAVINFLPLPIVDGGLFLFLIYEKLKGRPPSVQFQNITTMVGLFLIGTIFVVTFYNDIMRLL